MIVRLLPYIFLFLLFVYIFYITYKYFNRVPPKEGSKEYFNNLYDEDKDEFI